MDLFRIKKPLAILFVITLVSGMLLMAISDVTGQRYPQQYSREDQGPTGGGYAIPGIPGISLGTGTNTIALSASIASQQGSRTYFQVNSFAIMGEQSQLATVYTLSKALPGIMDASSNEVQIDISRLQSSMESTGQASMDDLYHLLRPSVTTLMVIARVTQQGMQGAQAAFQVQSIQVIMPDGQASVFDLSRPMSVVVDTSAMRVYAVGFPQLYSLVNTFIVNVQTNYYTSINYNIVMGPTIVITPPLVSPVLRPIAFPAVWPIYFPVPVPVPIPVVTVTPPPPSVTPTKKPTISPTKKPIVSPKVSPTKKPIVSPRATLKASPVATKKPVATTFKPPTRGGGGMRPIPTKKP